MKMHSLLAGAACALLLAVAPAALAANQSSESTQPANESANHVIPVLVNVDAKGKVTEVSPAYELRPAMQRQVTSVLEQMITAPAKDKHGNPVSGQFLIKLNVTSVPADNGQYKVNFAYVGGKALPAGQWHWEHLRHGKLALRSRDNVLQGFNDHGAGSHATTYVRPYVPKSSGK